MNHVRDLRIVVFQNPVSLEYRDLYEAAFQFWKGIWQTANAEMVRPTEFPSDPFTRQTEIICVFRGNLPVALVCNRHCDFSLESTYSDSAFFPETWLAEHKQTVRNLGGVGVMGSQITVHPDYRKTEGPISMKHLIVLLSVTRAEQLGADMLIGSMRTGKGLDRSVLSAGAKMIAPARPFFGASVDLIAFRPRENPIQVSEAFASPIRDLWRRAEFSGSLTFQQPQRTDGKKAA